MALHRVAKVTIGVPDVESTASCYEEFGLSRDADGRAAFSTADGGEQLELVLARRRRLMEFRIAADDLDDISRIAAALTAHDYTVERTGTGLRTAEPVSGAVGVVEVQAPAGAAAAGTNSVQRDRPDRAAELPRPWHPPGRSRYPAPYSPPWRGCCPAACGCTGS